MNCEEAADEIARLTAERDAALEAQAGHARTIESLSGRLASSTAEVERMQELGRQSMIAMEASSRTIDAYKAMVEAARKQCNRMLGIMGANAYDMGCRNTAWDILRALDGELNSVDKSGNLVKCPTCSGSGVVPNDLLLPTAPLMLCQTCGGTGTVSHERHTS